MTLTSSVRPILAAVAFGGSLVLTASFAVPASAAMNAQDRTFATKAAQGGSAEVAAARTALKNGSSPAVRAFAQRMLADHGAANAKLASIAQSENIALPSSPSATDAAMMAKMQAMHGASFDGAYLHGQETAHEATETLMQQEISAGKDPGLVGFAKATLPTVKAHLAMDKRDLTKMGSMGSMRSSM